MSEQRALRKIDCSYGRRNKGVDKTAHFSEIRNFALFSLLKKAAYLILIRRPVKCGIAPNLYSRNEKIEVIITKRRCRKSEMIRFAMFFTSKLILMYWLSKTMHCTFGKLLMLSSCQLFEATLISDLGMSQA